MAEIIVPYVIERQIERCRKEHTRRGETTGHELWLNIEGEQ